jgi:hypothetical protein
MYEVPPAFSLYHCRVDNKCDCSNSVVYSLKKVGNKVFPVYCAFYGIAALILCYVQWWMKNYAGPASVVYCHIVNELLIRS